MQRLYKWVKVYAPYATDRYEAELKEVRRENLKLTLPFSLEKIRFHSLFPFYGHFSAAFKHKLLI